jgi:hypothetical protein
MDCDAGFLVTKAPRHAPRPAPKFLRKETPLFSIAVIDTTHVSLKHLTLLARSGAPGPLLKSRWLSWTSSTPYWDGSPNRPLHKMKILVRSPPHDGKRGFDSQLLLVRFRRLCWRSFTFTCIYSLFASGLAASPAH